MHLRGKTVQLFKGLLQHYYGCKLHYEIWEMGNTDILQNCNLRLKDDSITDTEGSFLVTLNLILGILGF